MEVYIKNYYSDLFGCLTKLKNIMTNSPHLLLAGINDVLYAGYREGCLRDVGADDAQSCASGRGFEHPTLFRCTQHRIQRQHPQRLLAGFYDRCQS